MFKKTKRIPLGTIRNNTVVVIVNDDGILYARGFNYKTKYKQKKRIGDVFRKRMKMLGIVVERTLIKKGAIC